MCNSKQIAAGFNDQVAHFYSLRIQFIVVLLFPIERILNFLHLLLCESFYMYTMYDPINFCAEHMANEPFTPEQAQKNALLFVSPS